MYGTLVPGGPAWSHLARWTTGEPAQDAVRGVLYDTGRGYPAATFGADGLVFGAVAALDPARLPAALAALDEYEGPEYERITVTTESGSEAFAYHWIASLTGCRRLDDGRWPIS